MSTTQGITRAQADAETAGSKRPPHSDRNYSMFDAELSGAVLNMSLLGRILTWMRPYRVTFMISALLVLLWSTLHVMLPVILSVVVIDHIIGGQTNSSDGNQIPDFGLIDATHWLSDAFSITPLFAACLLYGIVQIAWAVVGHAHRQTLITSVIKGLRDLRLDLFAHLETRPSSFYDHVAVGRVMTRVTNDIEALFELLRGIGSLVGEFVPFFVALTIMLSIDAQLTGYLLLALPIMALITFLFRRATRDLFRKVRMSVSALNQYLQENLAGLQVVQISRREDYNLEQYSKINWENRNHETRSMKLEIFYGAFNDSMGSIAIGAILFYAAPEVIQGQLTLGGTILFTRFVDMLFHPIVALGEQTNVLFRAMASGERIFQALDWDEAIHEPDQPAQLPDRLRGSIEFRNLSFAYDAQVPVISDVSFRVVAGEKLAIVGPTGSGKSTLIRLLGRFYDFEDDQIFLDGIDLNNIHSSELRRRVGVVLQDFHIFSGSVYDNIALGDETITREAATLAARAVNAHDFISELSDGYDTQLSERGQNLSQGQRQLLAFARVLAANPEILVLDEATASIDTETELLIQDALEKITRGRTSIIIAHRLQTIQEADRILVLQAGRVIELGSHQELLALDGVYRELHELQFQAV